MPQMKFKRDWDWRVPGKYGVTIQYEAGSVYNVTRACAAEALAKGVATEQKAKTDDAGGRTKLPRDVSASNRNSN